MENRHKNARTLTHAGIFCAGIPGGGRLYRVPSFC